ncbi:MAG: DUF4339 domain-containing protein [Muribaculaceae bacterium]|nr:DUF4339 domain-containing protein [Muribaculaceae bacterium]
MEYYIAIGNQQTGPFPFEALATKGITSETLVWATGWPTWKPASQVPELAPLLMGAGTPPPIPTQVTLGGAVAPPPIPMAPAPAPVSRPAGGGNAMFRGVRVPGYQTAAPVSQVASQPAPQPQPYQAPAPQPQPYQNPSSQPVPKVQPAPQSQPSQPSQPVPAEETSVVATDKSSTSATSTSTSESSKTTEIEGTYKPSLTSPWLWQSIFVALVCFPLGLVPLYYSIQTKKANDAKDTELAKALSEETLKYLKIAFFVGGILWTIALYFIWKVSYSA